MLYKNSLILLLTIDWWLLVQSKGQTTGTANVLNNVNSSNDDNSNRTKQQQSNLTSTQSFKNEQMPITNGQILLSPSNKVNTEIDSQSLKTVSNSTINSSKKSTTLESSATNLSSVNKFIQNNFTEQPSSNQIKKSRQFVKKQFSTRRYAAKINEKFDKQVYGFHNERKSINMANNPKLYEILMKSKRSSDGVESITVGAILPKTALITKFRSYQKRLQDAVEDLMGSKNGVFHFSQRFRIAQAQLVLLSRNPTPTEILGALCDKLLPHNVSTIIYMSNSDTDTDNNAASALYLMQLTSYLGIPVICWTPDNIGLEQVSILF